MKFASFRNTRFSFAPLLVVFAIGDCGGNSEPYLGATQALWAEGVFWQATRIEWHALHGSWDMRVVMLAEGEDSTSGGASQSTVAGFAQGICEALLSHRPHRPDDVEQRQDIFRTTINFWDYDEDGELLDTMMLDRPIPVAVRNGQCLPIGQVNTFQYNPPLENWTFYGFQQELPPGMEGWQVTGLPVFSGPSRQVADIPILDLCAAALHEAELYREAGVFREGDRIAVGIFGSVEDDNFIDFFRLTVVDGYCVSPAEEQDL